MNYKTEQEIFWAGKFGDEYVERNKSAHLLAGNIAFFANVLKTVVGVESVIEFGSNVGMNLKAIKTLIPSVKCSAVEINHKAVEILKNDRSFGDKQMDVFEQSILEYTCDRQFDLALIKGVLIHINPNELNTVYEKLYKSSSKYICIAEYYNPTPVVINYRGENDRLFKRDFAGEFLDKYPDVVIKDYGFAYHGDFLQHQDDITWFLLEKK